MLSTRFLSESRLPSALAIRKFHIENDNGVRFNTPIYAIDANKLVANDAPLSLDMLRDKNTLIEINIGSESSIVAIRRLAALYSGAHVEAPPFYIALSPKLLSNSLSNNLKLLEKAKTAISPCMEFHMFTLVPVPILERLRGSEELCRELLCVPLVTASSARDGEKNTQKALRLQEIGIAEQGLLGASMAQSSIFSLSTLNKIRATIRHTYVARTPLLVYGARKGKSLNDYEGLRMAENMLQYFMAADVVGPPRKAGTGGAGHTPRPLLFVAHQGLYYSFEVVDKYAMLLNGVTQQLGITSIDELKAFSPARIEELNTMNTLAYTHALIETNPNEILEKITSFWRAQKLDEPLKRFTETAAKLRQTVSKSQESLDPYL